MGPLVSGYLVSAIAARLMCTPSCPRVRVGFFVDLWRLWGVEAVEDHG
jgi:hypothetical protein